MTHVRRYVDLIRQLTAKADPIDPGFASQQPGLSKTEMRERLVRDITFRLQALQDGASMLAGQCDRGPLVCHRYHDDANAQPFALPPLFDPLRDTSGSATGRRDEHAIIV